MRRRPFGLDPSAIRDRRKSATRPRFEPLEDRRLLTQFVVNTNDNGSGSLRAAILAANGTAGGDTIDFNISGSGVHKISLTTGALPTITNAILVDGTSQPTNGGATVTTPLIQIDGSTLPAGTNDGLTINLPSGTSPATIRGLAISGFSGSGVVIRGVGGNSVQENLIGTSPDGTAAAANGTGVSIIGSANNSVGGITSTFRNVISGNTGSGISLTGSTSSGNVIEGNLIGTNVAGVGSIPNANGVVVSAGASNNTIGGAIVAARDVISGNTGAGVTFTGANTAGNVIEGEYIGLTSSGTAALPNAEGVMITAAATSNSIGGAAVSNRNIISGNTTDNIRIAGATNNAVVGNTVGLTSDGTKALPGTQASTAGIEVEDGATGNTIGGVSSTAENVIGSATGPGLQVRGKTSSIVGTAAGGNLIEGNFIGTNLAGTATVPNAGGGLVLRDGTTNNTVGGTTGGLARNVVSGNTGEGIALLGTGTTGNAIQANLIGVESDGTTALGNTNDGVFIDAASNNSIGGTVAAASNTIANNAEAGVFVNTGTGDLIRHNSIFTNSGIGIDLAPRGVNPNSATQPGVGPNNLQNYPVLTGVTSAGGVSTVKGTFASAPATTYTLDFYYRNATDAAGIGQGRNYAGSTTVTTDASGNATISAATTTAIPSGAVVTATATDPSGNTSEFSADLSNAPATVDLSIALTASPTAAAVGGFLTYTMTVTNNGGTGATNVVATNTLPTGLNFIGATSSTGSVTQSGTTVTANFGSLAAGATATSTITLVTTSTGTLTDTASVTQTETDVNLANNTATVTSTVAQGVDLAVVASASPTPATVGSPTAIIFTVTNNSAANTSTNTAFNAVLPTGATVVSSTSSQGTTSTTGGKLSAAIGSLAPGASATVTVVLNPTTVGNLAFSGTATSTQPDVNPANNTTSAVVPVASASSVATVDGPTVIEVDRSGYHRNPTRVNLTYSGSVIPSTATNLANYKIVSAGKDGKFGTKDDVNRPIQAITYNTTTHVVTLRLKRTIGLHTTVVLKVVGSNPGGVRGTGGQLLDGGQTGQPGSDFFQEFTGVGPGRLSLTAFHGIKSKRK